MLTDRHQNIELPSFSSVHYEGQICPGSLCGSDLNEFCFRCATMCLLTTLSTFYPSFMFLFQVKFKVSFLTWNVEHWQMLCYLILIITALHDHRHCLPLAPSPHLPSSGDFRDLKIEPSKTELSINLSIFRVQPVTSLSIPLATTGCASTILIGINTFDSILPTSANYLIERCSSPCAPAMSSSTPGMWIITSQCNFD